MIPEHTDMAHFCIRNKVGNTFYHSKPGSKNRNENNCPGKLPGLAFAHRSFYNYFFHRKITGDFICHQGSDLTKVVPEILCSGLFAAKLCQLMCYQRMF